MLTEGTDHHGGDGGFPVLAVLGEQILDLLGGDAVGVPHGQPVDLEYPRSPFGIREEVAATNRFLAHLVLVGVGAEPLLMGQEREPRGRELHGWGASGISGLLMFPMNHPNAALAPAAIVPVTRAFHWKAWVLSAPCTVVAMLHKTSTKRRCT